MGRMRSAGRMVSDMDTVHSERSVADRTCRFRRIDSDGFRLAFEVTRRCDLSCDHCFVQPGRQHPTTGEVTDLIRQGGQLRCRKLIVTGGEPLLRQDLEQIITAAVEEGMLVDLNSNLFSLTPKRTGALKAAGLQEASVSLYGGRQMHDELTRKKGAFDRALQGIEMLREADITVDVHGAVWNGMLPYIDDLVETARRYGVSSISFFRLLPAETRHWSGRELCPEDALEAVERARTSSSIPIRTVGLLPPERGECVMGNGIYGLGADLRLSPCLLSRRQERGIDMHTHRLREAIALLDAQVKRGEWHMACYPFAGEKANG